MNWITKSTDSNGVTTFYPPEPIEEQKLQCSQCGRRVQFLHFYSGILRLLKDDDIIPRFCNEGCAGTFALKKILGMGIK